MRSAFAVLLVVVASLAVVEADAALPPFELVQAALEQERSAIRPPEPMRVTVIASTIAEYALGFKDGEPTLRREGGAVGLSAESAEPYRFLWIALFSPDPIAAIVRPYGLVESARTRVDVSGGEFVYVYGARTQVAVHRDFRRLAWFEVTASGARWRTTVDYDQNGITGVTVTRDGAPRLTARAAP